VPPLREIEGAGAELIAHFVALIARRHGCAPVRFTDAALERLRLYRWPGNVRELRNLVERATLMSADGTADIADLPEELRGADAPPADTGPGPGPQPDRPMAMSLTSTEQQTIETVIQATGGNLSDAAGILGISRSTLYRKMSQYGIRRDIAAGPHANLLKLGCGYGRA